MIEIDGESGSNRVPRKLQLSVTPAGNVELLIVIGNTNKPDIRVKLSDLLRAIASEVSSKIESSPVSSPAPVEGQNSWLTTHYPHPRPDDHPWHIYLKRDHKKAVDGIKLGDIVFFYEFKEAKAIDGGVECPTGRQGIVQVARVSDKMYERPARTKYADGTVGEWQWGIPTDDPDTDGFVDREDLLPIIGHKPGSVLRGFNRGAGIMLLEEDQSKRLMAAFKAGQAKK